jgi:hypothetical protein
MSYEKIPLDVAKYPTLRIKKTSRSCLLFPGEVRSLRPIKDSDACGVLVVVKESVLEIAKVVRVERVGQCVFVENLQESNADVELLGFYVVFAGGMQAVRLLNDGCYSSEEAEVFEFGR